MKRREFLLSATAVAGLATSRAWARQSGNPKIARIGMSSRSFGALIKMGNGAPNPAVRTLDFLDLPQMIADRYGIHHIELEHAHFMSTDDAYLKSLRARATKAKSQIIQISTNFTNTSISSTGPTRVQGIDLAKSWIDHAVALGCPRVMVSAGSLGSNVRATAIDALKTIDVYAKAHKVTISIQNSDTGVAPPPPAPPPQPAPAAAGGRRGSGGGGGRSNAPAPPATWQAIAEAAQSSGVHVTPDFAGFPNDAERTAGLKALVPLADGNCHVSTSNGMDLTAAIKTTQAAGYNGLYTVTVGGEGTDQSAAVKSVVDELLGLI